MKKYNKPISSAIIDFEKPNEYQLAPLAAIAGGAALVKAASALGGAALAAAAAGVSTGAGLALAHKGMSSNPKTIFDNPLEALKPIENI